jgi:hypothetical protein
MEAGANLSRAGTCSTKASAGAIRAIRLLLYSVLHGCAIISAVELENFQKIIVQVSHRPFVYFFGKHRC